MNPPSTKQRRINPAGKARFSGRSLVARPKRSGIIAGRGRMGKGRRMRICISLRSSPGGLY
ncbi:MAG TPA: hypothetical protein PK530_07325 [Anaerolineales bacterium]|nr:hypothetical protein [Anaerolineales bacterium]